MGHWRRVLQVILESIIAGLLQETFEILIAGLLFGTLEKNMAGNIGEVNCKG